MAVADTLPAHRIPAAIAVEAASETVSACAKQGYHETALVLDADGATIVAICGDGAGVHTLDSAHDKAYTAVSFKNDTLALAERAKGEDLIAPLAKLPHVMFFGGGVVIKLGDETIGAIGAARRPGANWMTPAPTPAWRKSASACNRRAFRLQPRVLQTCRRGERRVPHVECGIKPGRDRSQGR